MSALPGATAAAAPGKGRKPKAAKAEPGATARIRVTRTTVEVHDIAATPEFFDMDPAEQRGFVLQCDRALGIFGDGKVESTAMEILSIAKVEPTKGPL